jgi:hypothetical protein
MTKSIEIIPSLHVAVCMAAGCLEKTAVLVREIDRAGRARGRRELCSRHGWEVAERARRERRPVRLLTN